MLEHLVPAHRRSALICAAAAAFLTVGAADASASQTFERDGTLFYYAKAGEANTLTVKAAEDGTFTVRDAGATITPGAGCTRVPASADISCAAGADTVRALLADGDDSASVTFSGKIALYGGSGSDTLGAFHGEDDGDAIEIYGESGSDTITATNGPILIRGGSGKDTIEARDATTDLDLDAGDGDDAVRVIANDGGPADAQSIHLGAGVDTLTLNSGEFGGFFDTDYGQFDAPVLSDGTRAEDTIDGGTGSDTVNLGVGFGAAQFDLNLSHSIERLDGSGLYGVLLIGDEHPNRLTGGPDSDVIIPGGGNDTVYANGGDDQILASDDGIRDDLVCGAGDDTVVGLDPLDKLWNCESHVAEPVLQ